MAAAREVVVLSGVRTPVGNYGGSLKDFSPAPLGAMVIQEAVARAGVAPDDVGQYLDRTPDQRDRLHPDCEGAL
jgi:acetyl-CoA C-acetyltransferase